MTPWNFRTLALKLRKGLLIKWKEKVVFRADCNTKKFSLLYFHYQQIIITYKYANKKFDRNRLSNL